MTKADEAFIEEVENQQAEIDLWQEQFPNVEDEDFLEKVRKQEQDIESWQKYVRIEEQKFQDSY